MAYDGISIHAELREKLLNEKYPVHRKKSLRGGVLEENHTIRESKTRLESGPAGGGFAVTTTEESKFTKGEMS